MSAERLLNLIASVVGILSLGLAIAQTVRARNARAELERIRRIKNADIWSGISLTLQAYETIDDARELIPEGAHELSAKIGSARRAIVGQYLQQLRQAVLDEPEFTEETVKEWRRVGRLENEWRVAQAMKFVRLEQGRSN